MNKAFDPLIIILLLKMYSFLIRVSSVGYPSLFGAKRLCCCCCLVVLVVAVVKKSKTSLEALTEREGSRFSSAGSRKDHRPWLFTTCH